MLAIVAVVLLGGSLTTKDKATNNPESERADEVRLAAVRSKPSNTTDIVVIRSEAHTVDSPQFEFFVREFLAEPEITASVGRAPSSTTKTQT